MLLIQVENVYLHFTAKVTWLSTWNMKADSRNELKEGVFSERGEDGNKR